MLGGIARGIRAHARRRGYALPVGYNWAIVLAFDATVIGANVVAILQRPSADLPAGLLALVVCTAPFALFYISGIEFKAPIVWATWCTATAVLLFATATPIANDFAPLIAVLMVGEVASLTGVWGGFLASLSGAALLLTAAAQHRLEAVPLYLGILGMGWLVGYLVYTQQQLMRQQQEAQAALARHAAVDERRRIAREVHDVIAHSLSVTLLHVTGARRGLQQDRDVDDAVEALEQAERLGRQAMADIRRTVGLLDGAPMSMTPEPGVDDIFCLVDDFVRAGLNVHYDAGGRTEAVSAAVGLALYRIAQESLANIAKHAPDAEATVLLRISRTSATLTIANRLPVAALAGQSVDGRGLRGMRQRVELLGGIISVGPADDSWSVRTNIPLDDTDQAPRGCPLGL
ncbi:MULTISPECIES: sensor histidine kinase [unclassified Mycolicibacterium]|uniref:sensor histidine kinase n=1 Tax=unclassified Mycolicibacterium TaxID=2636767 RepID=UPI0012DC1CF1|nr:MULTISPECIES: histidine kinase [unclassified Mycolicibacterium]MUL82168.1 two-component sensor histidine kinase [Mycolicibacterium sp. CBMA 329]MUL87934.1 two-component sensor histidine kinase [Mycolicibacterium sp. CBMA 331]MUM02265.1 two-component sensor histidine kinase [Mycolicibacterium sp. CBMA 334]MUM26451.1 two-component sensor histidine kinase [Mycolicibacterium sp. CBMA 295]MUM38231.1 two-component sensor histidine kinase [Mycolicibacterium sp. CBMA 247]